MLGGKSRGCGCSAKLIMADALVKELGVEDLYGFLNVSSTATEKEVR